jgi:hypothetical protein
MSLKESSATALVRFTGLGIVCFNEERRRGEIAAIRDGKHTLSVKIQRPVFHDGGGGDLLLYRDVAVYEDLPAEGVRVEISASGAGALEGYEIYRGGDFDRLDSPDPHDFRWIVHMDSLHGDTALQPTGEQRHPLAKLYIGNGLFYTHKLDTNLFFEKLEKDTGGRVTRREVFGNVGETIGVKIEGEEVVFTISVGGREETHTLKRVEGLPYRIEIKNMDYGANAVYSDMPDYYGYIASPDGSQYELAPINEEEEGGEQAAGGAVNQKDFCHPIATDLSSIDAL